MRFRVILAATLWLLAMVSAAKAEQLHVLAAGRLR